MNKKKADFLQGVTAAIPISIGYIPIAIAFGIISIQSGFSLLDIFLLSAMVYAGASQFMAVHMLATGAGGIEIVVATFVLNLRHLIMSMSLMNRLKTISKTLKTGLSFGLTDETFAVASLHEGDDKSDLTFPFVCGLMVTAYSTWVIVSLLGGLLANVIPQTISSAMTIALYAMFIGLLVPAVRGEWKVGVIALSSMLLSAIFQLFLNGGWPIVLATILGGLVSVILPSEE
jgi:4-azaleucine resistance transporter AzlC